MNLGAMVVDEIVGKLDTITLTRGGILFEADYPARPFLDRTTSNPTVTIAIFAPDGTLVAAGRMYWQPPADARPEDQLRIGFHAEATDHRVTPKTPTR